MLKVPVNAPVLVVRTLPLIWPLLLMTTVPPFSAMAGADEDTTFGPMMLELLMVPCRCVLVDVDRGMIGRAHHRAGVGDRAAK